jgi:exodeoxyribonuclease VIII
MTPYRDIRAMNWSTLKRMKVPAEFLWASEHAGEDVQTPAMLTGLALHCMVLEPDLFDERYVVSKYADFRKKVAKDWRAEQQALGVDVLTSGQMATVTACAAAIVANEDAQELLEGCEYEVPVTWTLDGVKCKARHDALKLTDDTDIKTCQSLDKFVRVRRNRHGEEIVEGWDFMFREYHGASAFYRDGAIKAGKLKPNAKSNIIAVETQPPYDCAVFQLAPHALEAGRRLYMDYLTSWKACKKTGRWPGRFPGVTRLELASWAPGMDEGEEF